MSFLQEEKIPVSCGEFKEKREKQRKQKEKKYVFKVFIPVQRHHEILETHHHERKRHGP